LTNECNNNNDIVNKINDVTEKLQSLMKRTIDEDTYNLDAFDQCEGAWPIGHPLPLPSWSNKIKTPLIVDKIWQYEDIVALIEVTLHRLLEETHYNTVNNFLDFYSSFKKSNSNDLRTYFQNYVPPINRRHHMCVSLAMEIVARLSETCPGLAEHFFLVSCEEALESVQPYIVNCKELGIENAMYNLEKEHSLIAMRVNVAGREGLMLLDPGYHVARAVTVMKDQNYPHTGWFIQSKEPHLTREYCYRFNSEDFIEWSERTTRGVQQTHEVSLIYVKLPYRTAIDVTVRRNLVYNFRSLLSRDAKGRVCAGIYFPVAQSGGDSTFTLFYDGPNDQSIKIKYKFNTFMDETKIPEGIMNHLNHLSAQLRMSMHDLCLLLKSIYEAVADQDFVKQVLAINDHITAMSADN